MGSFYFILRSLVFFIVNHLLLIFLYISFGQIPWLCQIFSPVFVDNVYMQEWVQCTFLKISYYVQVSNWYPCVHTRHIPCTTLGYVGSKSWEKLHKMWSIISSTNLPTCWSHVTSIKISPKFVVNNFWAGLME